MLRLGLFAPALTMLLLLACCDGEDRTAVAPSSAPSSRDSAPVEHRLTPREVVEDPASRLTNVSVIRTADGGLRVAAGWACLEHGCRRDRAIAVSDDGFATARYVRWDGPHAERLLQEQGVRPTYPGRVTGLGGLPQWTATSLSPGVVGVVGGGDGATLCPFERTARSNDGGRSFTTVDVPLTEGARAYASGFVVLPDGRLLALLDHWSDDLRGRPSDRPHGLYVSDGADWSSYAALEPRFSPLPAPAPRGFSPLVSLEASAGHGGVIWARTWDDHVYVSTDAGMSFRRIAIR